MTAKIDKKHLCAHRGASLCAPENTLPAFEMALGKCAEIELDVWACKDGELFVCHDHTVDRTTNGHGAIAQLTTRELKRLDAGAWFDARFTGTCLPTFEEAVALISGQALLNLHIKTDAHAVYDEATKARRAQYSRDYAARPVFTPPYFVEQGDVIQSLECRDVPPYPEEIFMRLIAVLDKYHMRGKTYITGKADVLLTAQRLAPDMPRCCLEGDENYTCAQNAVKYGCARAQFCKLYLTRAELELCKAHGIHANLFQADDLREAGDYLALGIDTILTNDILTLAK